MPSNRQGFRNSSFRNIKKTSKIIFDNNGKKLEISILDGHCKLQWKVDWAMRWYALDIDFEMYGKDLIESAILSSKIVKLIGKTNPSGFAYELFLDEKGEKISKSKGNGITINQWLRLCFTRKSSTCICIKILKEQKNSTQMLSLKLLMNI